jgi:transcription elongation factor SPT6
LRQAIALARMIDDPLIELGQLFNSEEDILCLNLHTFQSRIGKEELIEEIGEEFVQWTNMVGLDFNECLTDPRKGHMLQFICGLGPAKASFLIRVNTTVNRYVGFMCGFLINVFRFSDGALIV